MMANKNTGKKPAVKTTASKNAARSGNRTKVQIATDNTLEDDRLDSRNRLIGRGISSLILTLFAIFLIISIFGVQAALLNAFASLAKGLFGYGYYTLPVALLGIVWVNLLHLDRPVKLRTCSIFLLVIFLSGLIHCLFCGISFSGLKMVASLWNTGIEGGSGGVIPGLLAQGLSFLIHRIGASIVLILLSAVCIFIGFDISAALLLHKGAEHRRERQERMAQERPAPVVLTRQDTIEDLKTLAAPPMLPALNRMPERQKLPSRPGEAFDFDSEQATKLPRKKLKATPKAAEGETADDDLIFFRLEQKKSAKKAVKEPSPFDIPIGNDYTAQIQQLVREELGVNKPEPTPDFPEDVFTPDSFTPTNTPKPRSKKKERPAFEVPDLDDAPIITQYPKAGEQAETISEAEIENGARQAVKEGKLSAGEAESAAAEISKMIEAQEDAEAQEQQVYQFPPMTMLTEAMSAREDNTEEMRTNVLRLEETLGSFGVDIQIENVVRGPTVTRYEMQLKPGVKMSKITSLHQDIALSLGVTNVRVSAVPGKSSVIGIEVPNRITTSVPIREVLASREFTGHKSPLAFSVGKDIGGNYIVGDIAKMPHLLIAGTTGSGKSVCMNSIIVSLLYRSTPEQVRLIMIDPKVVELSIYNDIPHLLIPVVTDPKKAAGSLQWAVTEMERRYRLLADHKVRDLAGYNKIAKGNPDMTPMPQIVIIIDELADLMLVAAKEVENSIVRIAQKARAAGMHLVIATQRPSADVITGVMKANIPSRIAFAVSSALESRIILDDSGAEKLVGKGDMLFAPLGAGKPKRVQGCFITDEEVEEVAEFVKKSAQTDYSDEIIKEIEQNASADTGASTGVAGQTAITTEGDELLPEAVEVILDTKQASVSMLQRRLKLGYAHAARIVDEMEEKGIVGPFEGSKPRQLLITREQWNTMVGINPRAVAPEEIMTADVSMEDDVPFEEDEEL